jgi:teichuronic acid biosynthesis glycosyltransferase TuaC
MGFPYQSTGAGATPHAAPKRRIAVVTTSWPWSEGDPSGHFVRAEVRALRDAGADVVVFAPRVSDGVQSERTFSPGIDVVPIPALGAFGFPGVIARVRARPWRALGAAQFVRGAQAALRHSGPYDCVIAHWAVPSVYPVLVGIDPIELACEIEVVSHGGDVRLLAAMPSPLRHYVVGRILDRTVRWRFVSEALSAELLSSIHDPVLMRTIRERSVIAPATFEMPDVTKAANELRARHGSFVSSIGRLVATKRVDVAVRAASSEAKRLVIVGDGPERPRLERLARELGVERNVTFTGLVARDEALAWLAASTELWFASTAEGSSTVLREAHALGRPVRRLT